MPDLMEQLDLKNPQKLDKPLTNEKQRELVGKELGKFKQVDNVMIKHDDQGRVESIRVFDKKSGFNLELKVDYENNKLIVSKLEGRGGLVTDEGSKSLDDNGKRVSKDFEEDNTDAIVTEILSQSGTLLTPEELSDIQEVRKNTYLI